MAAKSQLASPRSRRYLSQRTGEAIWGYITIAPWLIGVLLLTIFPMAYSIYLSFFDADFLGTMEFVGLDNYKRLLFEDTTWPIALRNTAFYAFVSVPIGLVLSLLVAVLLNQKVKALALFRTIFYLPSVVQGVAVAVLWKWLFHPWYGPINGLIQFLGLGAGPDWFGSQDWAMPAIIIMSQWGIGGSMIIFLAGLQDVPQSLYEAASIDGAGTMSRFWHITVPMMTPTLFFSLIMGIIGSWQMFTQSYVMTGGGPNNATLTAVLLLYQRAFQGFHFGLASAMAWILFIIILIFTLLILKSSAAWVYYEGDIRK